MTNLIDADMKYCPDCEDLKERTEFHKNKARAIRSGKLTRTDKCGRCGSDKFVEAHHSDYSKPLDVTWLCSMCHKEAHNG